MKRNFVLLILAAVAAPILLRTLWYFPGFSVRHAVSTPDYVNLKMPAAPISTPQPWNVKKAGGTIILDYAHGNQFQPNELQTLFDALTDRGARIITDSDSTDFTSILKVASAYIVISPSAAFSEGEVRLVREFVGRGGRLAVFTDATRGVQINDFAGNTFGNLPDVNNANPLLEPFGLSVNADYLYNLVNNDGNFRNVFLDVAPPSELTHAVQKVAFYGTHSVETESGSVVLIGDHKTLSSLTDATPGGDPQKVWAGAALSSDGNVLAFGDFTFLTPPYNTVADNGPLVNNIADFLVEGKRQGDLADYPYLFSGQPADILLTSNVQMTAEMIGALARLQSGLQAAGIQTRIVREAPSTGNTIVLGTYSLADDLDRYVAPFGLQAVEFGESIELPSFGKLGRAGTGVLLFSSEEKNRTLVLLADTVDDVTTLMDTLSGGDLSGCILQQNQGVCSIGFGGSFSDGSATPESTPTIGLP